MFALLLETLSYYWCVIAIGVFLILIFIKLLKDVLSSLPRGSEKTLEL